MTTQNTHTELTAEIPCQCYISQSHVESNIQQLGMRQPISECDANKREYILINLSLLLTNSRSSTSESHPYIHTHTLVGYNCRYKGLDNQGSSLHKKASYFMSHLTSQKSCMIGLIF